MGIDVTLEDWRKVSSDGSWSTILVGNGASINIWPNFRYEHLFDRAEIAPTGRQIFADLRTENFEEVLGALHYSRIVDRALSRRPDEVDHVYQEIKTALFEAVRRAHLPSHLLDLGRRKKIAATLDGYSAVYTTNYDLCLYWSHMETKDDVNLMDFFWGDGNTFPLEVTSEDIRGKTPIYYLHGGVHLWQGDDGSTGKWTYEQSGNLLDGSKYSPGSSKQPLFVSEGTPLEKLRAVLRSPYLRFCFDQLAADTNDTVIFGHSLASEDEHVASALTEGPPRRIAVSLRRKADLEVLRGEMFHLMDWFGRHEVRFFDAATHPLGDPALRVNATV